MNDHNAAVARRVIAAIGDFEAETLTLDEIQAALESAVPLFENDGSRIDGAVRLAEADLEEIQLAVLLDEQRPAAIFRLDELRGWIEGLGDQ